MGFPARGQAQTKTRKPDRGFRAVRPLPLGSASDILTYGTKGAQGKVAEEKRIESEWACISPWDGRNGNKGEQNGL
jgi:hypothetical protein